MFWYGQNPYTGHVLSRMLFVYPGGMPKYINPMIRVVVAIGKTWSFPYLIDKDSFKSGDLEIT